MIRKISKWFVENIIGTKTKCSCPTECDCERFPTHVSNECPIHNENPYPSLTCPIHGESV